jgi:hypothetical protein
MAQNFAPPSIYAKALDRMFSDTDCMHLDPISGRDWYPCLLGRGALEAVCVIWPVAGVHEDGASHLTFGLSVIWVVCGLRWGKVVQTRWKEEYPEEQKL